MEGKKMTIGRAARWMVCALLIGAIVGGSFGFGYTKARSGDQSSDAASADYMLTDNGVSGSSSQELLANPLVSDKVKEVTEKVKDSVVVIITRIQSEVQTAFGQSYVEEASALGSGVVFKEDDDKIYVLTNAHVLESASEAYLYFEDGSMVNVYLVGESVSKDLAVIYVNKSELTEEMMSKLKVATLGDSSTVRKGDLAIAIGSPYSQNMAHTTTVGIVTGVDLDFEIEDRVLDAIQTDASLNPGNSGGALVNENGEVIGINSAGIRDGVVEGMGFAISINQAKDVIDAIFSGSLVEKATLSIQSSTWIDADAARMYRVPSGLFVYQLEDGGAAEKAGIRPGDVIVSVGGVKLTDENSLSDILASLNPGDSVEIEVIRNRDAANVLTLTAVLDGVSDTNTYLPTQADSASQGSNAAA